MYELRCLGEATLRSPAGDLVHFRSRKHLALLIYLALNADRAHRRERLATMLWSDTDGSRARHSLSQALYAVRRLLNGTVRIEGEDLEMDATQLKIDIFEFEGRLAAGDAVTAAELYRGEFLEGFWVRSAQGFEEWAERERGRIGAIARDALRGSIKTARNRSEWSRVRDEAERLIQLDPFDEAAYAELMRALWMSGDRADALNRYDQLKKVLAKEIGTKPSRETEGLAERIRSLSVRGGWQGHGVKEDAPAPFEDPPFVGRKKELEVLAGEWERVQRGESRAVALTGEAGIGKTRLVNHFLEGLRLEHVLILRGRCYEAERSLPYGPVAEALGQALGPGNLDSISPFWLAELCRIVPEISVRYGELPVPPPLEAEGSRRRLYEGIAQVLREVCDEQPVVWFIDDMQWADESSVSLLHYIQRRVTNGLELIVALRMEANRLKNTSALRALLEDQVAIKTSVCIGELDRGSSRKLIESVICSDASSTDNMVKLCAGNPFFAIELAQSLSIQNRDNTGCKAGLPRAVQSLFDRKLAQLGGGAIALVQQAAVIGSKTSRNVLRKAVDLPLIEFEDIVHRIVQLGIFNQEDEILAFRHDLLRQYTWEQIPLSRRRSLHLRAAAALIEVDAEAGQIGRQLSNGGDKARAYAYSLRAAADATRVFALAEAAELLKLALANAPTEATQAELWGRLGITYAHLHRFELARMFLSKRLAFLEHSSYDNSPKVECELRGVILNAQCGDISVDELIPKLTTLYERLDHCWSGDIDLKLEILRKTHWASVRSGKLKLVEQTISQVRSLRTGVDSPQVQWRASRILAIHECYAGNLQESEKLFREAISYSTAANEPLGILDSYIGLSILVSKSMDVELAEELFSECRELVEFCGDPWRKATLFSNCALAHLYNHNVARAEPLLLAARNCLDGPEEIVEATASVNYNLGLAAYISGDASRAKKHWKDTLAASRRSGFLNLQAEALAALGCIALSEGKVRQARNHAARATTVARRIGTKYVDNRFLAEELLAKLRVLDGKNTKALRRLEKITKQSFERDLPLYLNCQLARLEILHSERQTAHATAVAEELTLTAREKNAEWCILRIRQLQETTAV